MGFDRSDNEIEVFAETMQPDSFVWLYSDNQERKIKIQYLEKLCIMELWQVLPVNRKPVTPMK